MATCSETVHSDSLPCVSSRHVTVQKAISQCDDHYRHIMTIHSTYITHSLHTFITAGLFGFVEEYEPLWSPFTSDVERKFGFELQPVAAQAWTDRRLAECNVTSRDEHCIRRYTMRCDGS